MSRTRLQPEVVQLDTVAAEVIGKVMSAAEAFAKEILPALGLGWPAGVNRLMV